MPLLPDLPLLLLRGSATPAAPVERLAQLMLEALQPAATAEVSIVSAKAG